MKKSLLTTNSVTYTLNHLFHIANPEHNLQYDIDYNNDDCITTVSFRNCEKKIIFNLALDRLWYELIYDNSKIKWFQEELIYLNNKDIRAIPVLFWEKGKNTFVDIINENELVFNADIISSSFFMLSRWEEIIDKNRDKHGRFIAGQSVAYKQGFLNIPVVDEYAMVLRKYLKILFPNVDLGHNQFTVKLTHDIDEVRRFSGLLKTLRTIIGGDLVKRKSLLSSLESIKQAITTFKNKEADPYIKGIYKLAQISKENNLNSAFYFKTSSKGNYDNGYEIDTIIKNCIKNLENDGFEIGFHPGYGTFKNYCKFITEKNKMDKTLGYSYYGGRQHYLRFEVPTTWRYWEKAELKYDSTMGYAEHEGFRCGTCHSFKPFDVEQDIELNITEIPLIVMDVTLWAYRKLTPHEGLKYCIDLIRKCKEMEGNFVLLWHNVAIYNEWKPWFNMYREVVNYLSESVYLKV